MKRQLDRLKGKRLVTGDPNLMTKDEICINATPNGVEVKEIGVDGKIKDLAGSGGGDVPSGGNNWKYFDVTQVPKDLFFLRTGLIAMLARCVDATNDAILVGSYAFGIDPSIIKAIGVDLSITIAFSEYNFERITMEQYLNDAGFLENCASLGFVEITEDEFLNKTFV